MVPLLILLLALSPATGTDEPATPDKIFLDEIFSKYGNGGVMDFEGFEHLLDNLGLGGDIFTERHELEKHRINGTFSQIHDVGHRHKRHADKTNTQSKLKNCLSPDDILEVYGFHDKYRSIINEKTFMHMCPALVYQIDQRLCIKMAPFKETEEAHITWIYAGLSVLLISATGLLGVAVMPMIHSKLFNKLLHFLVALAIGTLCGDALLHLLPHALEKHEPTITHTHHNDPVFKCCATLLAVLLFFSIESIMTFITGSHGHSHNGDVSNSKDVELDRMMQTDETDEGRTINRKKKPMTPVAVMVILGDALHNITDGLAIGAAFSSDPVTGFATAIAIFCHELPHELGDFAVLLKSGMTLKKAIWCNVLSSVLSFAGTAGGLWLGEGHASSSQWIYATTAGTFLYIALVDLVPELRNNGKGKILDFCLSFLGILLGFTIMLSIALYEDSLISILE